MTKLPIPHVVHPLGKLAGQLDMTRRHVGQLYTEQKQSRENGRDEVGKASESRCNHETKKRNTLHTRTFSDHQQWLISNGTRASEY